MNSTVADIIKVIGIAGTSHGAGKSTFANCFINIFEERRWEIPNVTVCTFSFATPLKKLISDFEPKSVALDNVSDKEAPISELNGKSYRQILQDIGSFMRHELGDDVWVNQWRKHLQTLDSTYGWIVVTDDVRYLNEFRAIREYNSTMVYIDRPDLEIDTHESEGNITPSMCDYVVHNLSSKEEFIQDCNRAATQIFDNVKGHKNEYGN